MGGGSSVMGMVALRGTADDYDEWDELGAAGWGWDDVLPFFRKLESGLPEVPSDLHGRDGPVPIRRTPVEDWPPLLARDARLCAGTADPVHRGLERRLPRRLLLGADEQLAGQARVLGDLLSRRRGARAQQPDDRQPAPTVTDLLFDGRTGVGVKATVAGQDDARFGRRDHPLARRHPLAGHADALGHRAGGPSARARHRGARRPARRRRQSVQPRDPVRGDPPEARRAGRRSRCARIRRHCSGSRRACRAVRPPTCTSTSRARRRGARSAARSPTSRRCCGSRLRAAGCRSTSADPRQEPLVEFNFTGHELDLQRFKVAFRRTVDMLADERVRALGGVTFPVKFTDRLRHAQPRLARQCGQEHRHREAARSRSGVARAGVRDAGGSAGRSRSARARTMRRSPSTSATTSPASFIPPAPAAWGAANDPQAVVDHGGTRARLRGTARGRRLDHADGAARQHQHSDHHGGGENRRGHRRRCGRVSARLHSRLAFSIASQIARWDIGSSLISTPSGASASLTALATAAGAPR